MLQFITIIFFIKNIIYIYIYIILIIYYNLNINHDNNIHILYTLYTQFTRNVEYNMFEGDLTIPDNSKLREL